MEGRGEIATFIEARIELIARALGVSVEELATPVPGLGEAHPLVGPSTPGPQAGNSTPVRPPVGGPGNS